jgi:hypothetical protein
MTRSMYAIPVMVCLTAAAVGAQAPADKPAQPAAQQPAAQKPATPAPEQSTTSVSKVTYTGCVKPGTAAGTWVLENAEAAAKPGASASSTVGTSGASKMTFNLSPAATVNLTPHANHKVEVVGIVTPAKPSADAAASPAAGAQAPRQQIAVESLKMVSATCP